MFLGLNALLEVGLVRIALGQFNATVGDLAGNVEKMKQMWAEAVAAGADLVVFPELAICGYPPEDLVYKKQFVKDNRSALEELAAGSKASCPRIAGGSPRHDMVVGFVECSKGNLYNSAAVIQAGRIVNVYHKTPSAQYQRVRRAAVLQAGRLAR